MFSQQFRISHHWISDFTACRELFNCPIARVAQAVNKLRPDPDFHKTVLQRNHKNISKPWRLNSCCNIKYKIVILYRKFTQKENHNHANFFTRLIV